MIELKKRLNSSKPPSLVELQFFQKYDSRNEYANTEWRQKLDHKSGMLLDGGVHLISLLNKLFDNVQFSSRSLSEQNPYLKGNDTFTGFFNTACGVEGILKIGFGFHDGDPTIIKSYSPEVTYKCSKTKMEIISEKGKQVLRFDMNDDFRNEFRQFYSMIREGEQSKYSIDAALKDVSDCLELFK